MNEFTPIERHLLDSQQRSPEDTGFIFADRIGSAVEPPYDKDLTLQTSIMTAVHEGVIEREEIPEFMIGVLELVNMASYISGEDVEEASSDSPEAEAESQDVDEESSQPEEDDEDSDSTEAPKATDVVTVQEPVTEVAEWKSVQTEQTEDAPLSYDDVAEDGENA